MSFILGVSAYYHDSAAAVLSDGEIVAAAPQHLNPGAWLMLEHGYDQGAPVRDLLQGAGFTQVQSRKDLGAHERITLGRLPC